MGVPGVSHAFMVCHMYICIYGYVHECLHVQVCMGMSEYHVYKYRIECLGYACV